VLCAQPPQPGFDWYGFRPLPYFIYMQTRASLPQARVTRKHCVADAARRGTVRGARDSGELGQQPPQCCRFAVPRTSERSSAPCAPPWGLNAAGHPPIQVCVTSCSLCFSFIRGKDPKMMRYLTTVSSITVSSSTQPSLSACSTRTCVQTQNQALPSLRLNRLPPGMCQATK
jgi:hypothetical protein